MTTEKGLTRALKIAAQLFVLAFIISMSHSQARVSALSSYTISGTITNATGTVEEGVTVYAYDPGTTTIESSAATQADGTYSLGIPQGTYDFSFVPPSASGLNTLTNKNVSVTSNLTLNGALNTATSQHIFSGRLTDQNGNGLANITIIIRNAGNFTPSAVTDSAGNFSIEASASSFFVWELYSPNYPYNATDGSLPLGSFKLSADLGTAPTLDLTAGDVIQNLTLNVAPVSITTYNNQGYPERDGVGFSTPLSTDTPVSLYPGDPGEHASQSGLVNPSYSSSTGLWTATFGSIVGVTYSGTGADNGICSYIYGYGTSYLNWCNSASLTVGQGPNSLDLPHTPLPPNTFSGKLTDQNGNALSGVTIQLRDKYSNTVSATTGSDGSFSVNAEPGSYYIYQISGSGTVDNLGSFTLGQVYTTTPSLDLSSSIVQNLTLNVATVNVTTYNAQGYPTPATVYADSPYSSDTPVTLYAGDPGENVSETHSLLTSYSPTTGLYTANVQSIVGATYAGTGTNNGICADNYRSPYGSLGCNSTPLTITNGAYDLVLPHTPLPRNTFSGKLTDPSGNPIHSATIYLIDAYNNTVSGSTSTDGSFSISAEPGLYRLYKIYGSIDGHTTFDILQSNSYVNTYDIDLTSTSLTQNLVLPVATINVTTYNTLGYPLSAQVRSNYSSTNSSAVLLTLYPGGSGYYIDSLSSSAGSSLSSSGTYIASFESIIGITYSTGSVCEYTLSNSSVGCTAAPLVVASSANDLSLPILDRPSAPTNLTVAAPTASPVLSWDAVSGATSYLVYSNGSQAGTASTNSFSVYNIADGTYSYSVASINNAGVISFLSSAIDVAFPGPYYTVSGKVSFSNANNSAVAQNVLVDINSTTDYSGNSPSDASGTYAVTNLPSASYSISLENTSGGSVTTQYAPNQFLITSGSPYVVINGADITQNLAFNTNAVIITVKDGQGHIEPDSYVTLVNAVSGLVYSLDGQTYNLSNSNLTDTGYTGTDGTITMYVFPGMTYKICAAFPEPNSLSYHNTGPYCTTVTVGADMSAEVDLPYVYSISGNISFDGTSALAGEGEVTVTSSDGTVSQTVYTDSSGNYTLNNLPNGTYGVHLSSSSSGPGGYIPQQWSFSLPSAFTVNGTNISQNFSFATNELTIHVLDASGNPYTASDATVSLTDLSDNPINTTDGTFIFPASGINTATGVTSTGTITLATFSGETYEVCAKVDTGTYCAPSNAQVTNNDLSVVVVAAPTYSVTGAVSVNAAAIPDGTNVSLNNDTYAVSGSTTAGSYTVSGLIDASYKTAISYNGTDESSLTTQIPDKFSVTSATTDVTVNGSNTTAPNLDFTTVPISVYTVDVYGSQFTGATVTADAVAGQTISTSDGTESFDIGSISAGGLSTENGAGTLYLFPGVSYLICAEIDGAQYCAPSVTVTSGMSPIIISAAKPTGLNAASVTPYPQQPELTWNPVADTQEYEIFRNGVQIDTSPTNSYTDTIATTEGVYSYYVVAVNSIGVPSAPSDPISVIFDRSAPIVSSISWTNNPQLFGGTIATVTAQLTDSLTKITAGEYYVGNTDPGIGNGTPMIVSAGATGGSLTACIGGASQTCADGNNFPPGIYTINIRGKNAAGIWATLATTTLTVSLSPPTNLQAASPTSQPPYITWDAVDGASYYTVYRNGIDIGSSNTTLFTDTGAPGGTDTYTLVAISLLGIESDHSDPITVVYTPPPTLGTPSWAANPLVDGQTTTLSVPASDTYSEVTGGEYFIGTDPGQGNGIPMNWDGTNLTVSLGSDLAPGTYTVYVRAEDSAGSWSDLATTTLTVVLAAPTNLTAPSPTEYPALTWDGTTGASSYNIYRNGIKVGSSTDTTNGTTYTYTDSTAPDGTSSYYVTAVGSNGYESGPSNTIDVLVNTIPPTTAATLSPGPYPEDGTYHDPTTVTLSASAASGFNVVATYYTVDGGAQQTYSAPFAISGPGSHTITYWSVDNAGVVETANTKTFTVHTNLPPSIAPLSNATVNEGGTLSQPGSFSDYDSTSWTATVNYGDGSATQQLSLSGTNFSLNHTYVDEGTYTITVTVTDNQGSTGTATSTVAVSNAPFTVGAITGIPVSPIQIDSSGVAAVSATATFSDLGVLDTHTAVWNWGDGTTSTGTITESNGSGTVTGDHNYTVSGVYVVTLTVTDDDGLSETQTFYYTSIYNPAPGSQFNAGVWFDSPAGAYMADPSLTGKVKFGIQVTYDSSGMPTGSVKMNFAAGNINFVSTSITALVCTPDGIGTIQGVGTVNGVGGYTFLVTGIDKSQPGGDTVRFQIKDSSGNVIYDTQPGADETATPTTPVTAGHVLVTGV